MSPEHFVVVVQIDPRFRADVVLRVFTKIDNSLAYLDDQQTGIAGLSKILPSARSRLKLFCSDQTRAKRFDLFTASMKTALTC